MIQIGNQTFKNGIFLAPLAGVSDRPFRVLCAKEGAGLVYTEMISAKAVDFGNKKTEALLKISPDLERVAIQIFGNDPEIMAKSAAAIIHKDIALLDINMGCPVPKVVSNGEGSALMQDPDLVYQIVRRICQEVDIPVTVKIRAGFTEDGKNAPVVAKAAEEAGAKAIGVHGRTRDQFYSGKADWSVIKAVKETVKVPVLGNGDVFSAYDAKAMLDQTGCDGILVARGAQGNPWIFSEILTYLETGLIPARPNVMTIIETIMDQMAMLREDKGDLIAMMELRKHVAWYTKGLKNSTSLRHEINRCTDLMKVEGLLRQYLSLEPWDRL